MAAAPALFVRRCRLPVLSAASSARSAPLPYYLQEIKTRIGLWCVGLLSPAHHASALNSPLLLSGRGSARPVRCRRSPPRHTNRALEYLRNPWDHCVLPIGVEMEIFALRLLDLFLVDVYFTRVFFCLAGIPSVKGWLREVVHLPLFIIIID